MAVVFQDFSFQVKAQLNQTTLEWLEETASEIASQANRNVQLEDDAGRKLRGSYSYDVDSVQGEAVIGTPHEEGFWEEFGTGSYADTSKNGGIQGRPMWWVYVTNETPRTDNPIYRTEEEAKAVAASWREEGKDAHASNGRRPSYTLENAFTTTKPRAISSLEQKLKARVGQ